MNPAWIQHEFKTMLQPKYILKLPKFSRFSAAFWIGGLDLESKKMLSNLFPGNAWIQHESSMNGFFKYFLTPLQTTNPNHHSNKSGPIFFDLFSKKNIESDSCRFHAGCMLNSCIFRRVTLYFHSCQIHVRFMLNSCIFNDSEIWCWIGSFSKILVQIWLGRGWCWIHAEFMLNSCWFHLYLEVSQRFAQHFASHWCWIHAEFMLNSCKTVKNT